MKKFFTLISAVAVGAASFSASAADLMDKGQVLMAPEPVQGFVNAIELYYGGPITFVDGSQDLEVYQGNSLASFTVPATDVRIAEINLGGEEGGPSTGMDSSTGGGEEITILFVDLVDTFLGKTGDYTVVIPQGLVQNEAGAVNPEQSFSFSLVLVYTQVPDYSLSSDGIYSIIWDDVTAVSYNTDSEDAYLTDSLGLSTLLSWGKQITANAEGNGVDIDLSGLLKGTGTYELLIPEGYFDLTIGNTSYINGEIAQDISLSNADDDNSGDNEPGDDEPGDDEPGDDEPGDDEPGTGDQPGDDEPGDDEPGENEPTYMTAEATQVNTIITEEDAVVELTWPVTVSIVDASTLSIPVSYDGEQVGALSAMYVNLVPAGESEPDIDPLAETGDEGSVMYLLLGAADILQEAGEYTLTLPAGMVEDAEGAVNQQQTVTVTLVASVEGVVTPEEGTEFELGENVVITITYPSALTVSESVDAPVILTDYAEYDEQLAWEEDVVYVEGNAVVINLGELEAGTYYLSFRAGAVLVNGAPNAGVEDYTFVVLEGETDGIHAIGAELNGEEAIYNLNGVKLSKDNLGKGIYIINGKKVILK